MIDLNNGWITGGLTKLVTRGYQRQFATLALVLLLAGCTSREPTRVGGPQTATAGMPGVLWTVATYKRKFFEMWNHATVTEVDGVKTTRIGSAPPVELAPGKHTVLVRYDKDSYLCGYLGCIPFKQSTRQLELQVEPDHSYVPLAGKYCGKDWIWIVDTGGSAQNDLDIWREKGIQPYMTFDPRSPMKDPYTLKVEAGEAPPDTCEGEQE